RCYALPLQVPPLSLLKSQTAAHELARMKIKSSAVQCSAVQSEVLHCFVGAGLASDADIAQHLTLHRYHRWQDRFLQFISGRARDGVRLSTAKLAFEDNASPGAARNFATSGGRAEVSGGGRCAAPFGVSRRRET
ncbi:hypothetical protein UB47_23115, partial [Pseudomonas sp. 5]